MTNPSQHDIEMTTNTHNPHGIRIRLIFAFDMLWVGGVVSEATKRAVREFRDPGCHEMDNVI